MHLGKKSLAAGCIAIAAAFVFAPTADAFWGQRHYGYYQPAVAGYGGGYSGSGYYGAPGGGYPAPYFVGPATVVYRDAGVNIGAGYRGGFYPPAYGIGYTGGYGPSYVPTYVPSHYGPGYSGGYYAP